MRLTTEALSWLQSDSEATFQMVNPDSVTEVFDQRGLPTRTLRNEVDYSHRFGVRSRQPYEVFMGYLLSRC